MELVRKITAISLTTALMTACGQVSVTQTIPLETDTYISSADSANHAQLEYLRISKSTTLEERTIVKLPTTDQDEGEVISDLLNDVFLNFFLIPVKIIAALTSCATEVVQPANLSSAYLQFTVSNNAGGGLANSLQLGLLSKPWWQTANWSRAHPFSRQGTWTSAGGDLDSSFSTVLSAAPDSTTVSFDITSYLKGLISANGTASHYGFLIQSANSTLSDLQLHSTQVGTVGSRPRIQATYTASCGSGYSALRQRTTYLGSDPTVVDAPQNVAESHPKASIQEP